MGLFFFFKQKTAYEMRISDWSSDVCSSDLRGNAGAENTKTEQSQRTQYLRHGGGKIGFLALKAGRESGKQRRANARNDGQHHHQIGRESCRERVCQYV